jgi:hypothetical protein
MFEVKPHDPMPLSWWYEQRDRIDREPSYQRRSGVWDAHKQAFLIDSILNDYDMPKLYLADFALANSPLNEHRKAYAVIDGKQRLQAIFAFFEGVLVLDKEFQYLDDPTAELGGLSYFDLQRHHPDVAAKFENHVPAVMSVVTDEPLKIEQLFVRLNSGVQVNRAERRNAMEGIVPAIIRRLGDHQFFKTRIKFNTLRMADLNLVAKLLLIEHRGGFDDTKADNLDALVVEGIRGDAAPFEKTERRVKAVLSRMVRVFKKQDRLLGNEGHIPVYYWFVKHHAGDSDVIRDFLDGFVLAVRKNQLLVREDPKAGDPELRAYYTMSRTTNDRASLQGRYEILELRFKGYVSRRKRN